jgi:hypothetical protein
MVLNVVRKDPVWMSIFIVGEVFHSLRCMVPNANHFTRVDMAKTNEGLTR